MAVVRLPLAQEPPPLAQVRSWAWKALGPQSCVETMCAGLQQVLGLQTRMDTEQILTGAVPAEKTEHISEGQNCVVSQELYLLYSTICIQQVLLSIPCTLLTTLSPGQNYQAQREEPSTLAFLRACAVDTSTIESD